MALALPTESVFVPKQKLRFLQGLAAFLGVCLLALAALHFTQTAPETEEKLLRRFSFSAQGLVGGAISPDGRYVAYAAETEGRSRLWLRSLADETSRELPGTEGGALPFWSPDSLSIGFGVAFPNPELKRISIDGGAPTVLCEFPSGQGNPFFGGTWSPDGERIVFSSRAALYEIAARGGRPRLLSEANVSVRQFGPHLVPTAGGPPAFVYTAAHNPGDLRLMAFNLASGEVRELGPGREPVYSLEGYLIHGPGNLAGEGLWALPFSAANLEVSGDDFPISTSGSSASLSRDGTLVYSDAGRLDMAEKTLVWRNRAGEALETVGQPQVGLREFALSPDRRRVATTAQEPSIIWIQDLARSAVMRLTFEGAAYIPSWAPSGNDIVYTFSLGASGTPSRLMRKAADGTGEPTVLVQRSYGSGNADWSRNGRYLMFNGPSGEGTLSDILYVELERGDSKPEPKTFLSTPAAESVPKLSPDGRFVAYVSNESGQPEIYVRPFPGGAGRWQASVNGGKQPRWRDDGKELFYVEEDTRLMAVPVEAGEGLTLGRPQRLFESADLMFRGNAWPQYDVSADGQRFLTSTPVDRDVPPALRIVLNWHEQFRDRERDQQ
jgi:Tol biopolymer transport system component